MNEQAQEKIQVEVWGDFACFSQPFAKVERMTYPFPTPSAARGILSAIYCKPLEFYWQINRIEVLNPIRYISFRRNEVKSTISGRNPIYTDDERTQRQTVALRDVRYRFTATIVPRVCTAGAKGRKFDVKALCEQARRRIRGGKAFFQPGLGLREFTAYFEEPSNRKPIPDTRDKVLMVYDVFDFPRDVEVSAKTTPKLSLYYARMDHGVILVPPYDSPEVLKIDGIPQEEVDYAPSTV